jgi:hypothetical protein
VPSAVAPSGHGGATLRSPAEWSDVLVALERKRAVLASIFRHGRFLGFESDALTIGFPESAMLPGEMAREPESKAAMKSFLREHLGRAVDLHVRMLTAAESGDSASRSEIEETTERAVADRTKREREAREHPATKMVLKTFGVQIKEIKTDV